MKDILSRFGYSYERGIFRYTRNSIAVQEDLNQDNVEKITNTLPTISPKTVDVEIKTVSDAKGL